MGTGKAIILFILGLFLTLLVFPTALFVSTGLGYLFGITAIAIGAYLIAKHGGRTLPLILGLVLLILSGLVLAGTITVHIGALAVKEAIEKATKVKRVEASIGQPIEVDDWRITVTGVEEAEYVLEDNSVYRARKGNKIVIIHLRVDNIGSETRSLSNIWNFVLVTDTGKSYEKIYPFQLEWVLKPSEEIKHRAIKLELLDTMRSVAPGTYVEGDIIFQIPVNERPAKLHFKVGIIGETEVTVTPLQK